MLKSKLQVRRNLIVTRIFTTQQTWKWP